MREIKLKSTEPADRKAPAAPNLASIMMKKAYIKTREQAEEITNSEHRLSETQEIDDAEASAEEIAASGLDISKNAAYYAARKAKAKKAAQQKNKPIQTGMSETHSTGLPSSTAETHDILHHRGRSPIKTKESELRHISVNAAHNPVAVTGRSNIESVRMSTEYAKAAGKTIRDTHKAAAAIDKAVSDSSMAKQFAKQAADRAKKAAKASYKALKASIKGAIEAAKGLVSVIIAGGSVAIVIIIIICLLGLIVASAYGIFAGNEVSNATDGNADRDLRTAVSTINSEYYQKIQNIRSGVENLENTTIKINGDVGGMTGVWQDVLSVYAVDTAHGENATLAIDFDSSKTNRLREIFWSMVSISSYVTERIVEEEQEVTDENGNTTIEIVEVIYRDLTINVKTKSALQAAGIYSFDTEQNEVLTELMGDQFTKAWSDLIYGYSYGDDDIVAVAISQIGNIGGEPYWRWYGLSGRTEWCAIFVSWCADQCGYIDEGIIPKFAWVPDAVSWFQARGQWQLVGYTPAPGDIIFFDWEGDGGANHVGIVERVENGVVHTVEGNSGDACRRKEYSINSGSIMGYGIPMY